MNTGRVIASTLFAGVLLYSSQRSSAQHEPGSSFLDTSSAADIEGVTPASNTADTSLYMSGTLAINEGRWSDAEAIFTKVVNQHGDHFEGAHYWKAYAENQQGHHGAALASCAELRQASPASGWLHECGALEIEIHAKNGKPVDPQKTQDDDLKMLALNVLLQKDEARALAEIQEILNGDSSEKLKQDASFILGQHYSDETYAQIVRLSYVEGDVRIARGEQAEKDSGTQWEVATANLPLETGFSLVTGKGRAEIELEDASTLYLGENSVLTLNDLHTTSGKPYTDLALIAGTVSLNVHSSIAGESFILRTPTDNFQVKFPDVSRVRISSYLDGISITPQDNLTVRLPDVPPGTLLKGQTFWFHEGHRIAAVASSDPASFAGWDQWVANRVSQREAAMSQMMTAAGLSSPIPGLADMAGHGTFFACAPYGTCWEPTLTKDTQKTDVISAARPLAGPDAYRIAPHFEEASLVHYRHSDLAQLGSSPIDPLVSSDDEYFPCYPDSLRYRLARDPLTGNRTVADTGVGPAPASWAWAVCHAGTWIHRQHHYTWVAGHKRHHICPVRWVKSGRRVGFVPLHPYDVKGRPALNRKEVVFAVNDKNGLSVEKVKFSNEHSIEELKVPPREFREARFAPLTRAAMPHMEAHAIRDGLRGTNPVKVAAVPLTFDARSQTFMMAKDVNRGGKTSTTFAPVTNRGGTLQARGDSFAGSHGALSSAAHATSSSGHSGAGSGGGGAHGGGSSGGSSSGSAGSASSSSAGGGHR